MEPAPRRPALYTVVALQLLNTLVALIVINLLIAAVFGIADSFHRPKAGALRYSSAALDRAYPGMTQAARDSMLAEIWNRKLAFEPWTMFREGAYRGRFVNVSDAGFRAVPGQGPWPIRHDRFSVFVFGGSTTFGYGVADDQTVPAFLQEALRGAGGAAREASVYNFGRAYYFSTQERLLFEQLLIAGQVPDVAIFIDGLNDFYYAGRDPEMTDAFRAALDPPREKVRSGALVLALLRRTPMARLARALAGNRAPAAAPPPRRSLAPGSAGSSANEASAARDTIAAAVARYLANQKLIRAAASAYGVRTLFVWQPVPTYACDLRRHAFAGEGFAQHALSGAGYAWFDSARASGAVQTDRDFVWCAGIAERDTGTCYVDRVHYSGRMCRMIAERIASELRARGMLAAR
jgi:hypothetical protein